MFATKMLLGAAMAAGTLVFAAQPANADTRISVGIGCAPVYVAPAPVVVARPVYVAPAPTVVYREYCPPTISLDFGWFNWHRHHREFHPDYRR